MKSRRLPFALTLLSTLLVGLFLSPFGRAMPPLNPTLTPPAPDYSHASAWLVKPERPTAPVDVFFVYPTVLFNDTDWFMDTSSKAMQDAAMVCITQQASVFDGQANIYAPMYRQMNLAAMALSDADQIPLKKVGHDDVWRALQHYLKYENNNRPFFLAGHSQGSLILTTLMLEHWDSLGVEDRLVAALLPGWSITREDLASHPAIVMCDRPDRTGCVISYNTMAAGRQKEAPTLLPGAVAVNPLSWTMDDTFVPAEKNLGAVFFAPDGTSTTHQQFTSAQLVNGGVVVRPANVELVTVKKGHFPAGVYHAFDYSLFYENLKANIAERITAMDR